MDQQAFFTSWGDLERILIVGAAAYVALVAMLRTSGKRTLSKLNAFDLVVTVALGSSLSSILTSKDVSLAEGLTALALLIFLQLVVTWTSVRWAGFDRLVKSEPSVLLRHGQLLPRALRRERVAEEDVLAAIRGRGGLALADAVLVLLESDGSLTAVLREPIPHHLGAAPEQGAALEGRAPGDCAPAC